MIATNAPGELGVQTDDALARVPQRAFGDTEWVAMALKASAQHLEPAIASGQPYRIANAIRAIVHVPTAEQRHAVITAACDTLLTNAYTSRNARLVSAVAEARGIIDTVLIGLDEIAERTELEPAVLRETVDGFVRMAALIDPRLADRLEATGRLAARIGNALHLSRQVVTDIEFAGCLHDIGMVSMPGSSRTKDELHSRKERGLKSHTIVGESFLQDVPALAHLAPIVRSHHERFDGSGYPDGLRGNEIPLESRVISVAAAFIERITAAPNQDVLLPQDVCQELLMHSGTRFDPDVVSATLQLLHFRQRTNRSA
jgi:HD-GYP domain-containing protein (c-di-GMP phosphodiesterase class II)